MQIRTVVASLMLACPLPASAADLPSPPAVVAPLAEAQPGVGPFFLHVGVAGLILDEGASIRAAGTRLQGATIKIPPHVTATLEAGYYVAPNIAIALTVGVPPHPEIDAAGTIAGVGKLGSIVYGPTAATLQYHFSEFGAIRPYVGAGPLYMIVFSDRDAALSQLRVDSAWGAVGQVGADIMLSNRWGVFVDLKKAYLRTEARGQLGAVPITAHVRLDPLVLSGGITYLF